MFSPACLSLSVCSGWNSMCTNAKTYCQKYLLSAIVKTWVIGLRKKVNTPMFTFWVLTIYHIWVIYRYTSYLVRIFSKFRVILQIWESKVG